MQSSKQNQKRYSATLDPTQKLYLIVQMAVEWDGISVLKGHIYVSCRRRYSDVSNKVPLKKTTQERSCSM